MPEPTTKYPDVAFDVALEIRAMPGGGLGIYRAEDPNINHVLEGPYDLLEDAESRLPVIATSVHIADLTLALQRQAETINQIKIALEQVAVYEGIVGVSPTVMLVTELVRDHEELERRIDQAILICRSQPESDLAASDILQALLGRTKTPDSLEGLGD